MSSSTVVLTRDAAGNRRWAAGLQRAGFVVLSAPMIETASLNVEPPDLSPYRWLVITSARALPALHLPAQPAAIPVAVVGPATAKAAAAAGLAVAFQPHPATAAALVQQLHPVAGQHILVARSTLAGPRLAAALRARGADVTDLPVYETRPRTTPHPELEHQLAATEPLQFVFASPSAVRACLALHPSACQHAALALGPTTAAAARAAGFRSVREAATPNLHSLISALRLL